MAVDTATSRSPSRNGPGLDYEAKIEAVTGEQTRPLHLFKRNISCDSISGTRRSSRKSNYTEGSADSAPWDDKGHLTIMKRRSKIRSNDFGGPQTYGYATVHAPPRQTSWSCFRPMSREFVGSQTLNIRKNRQIRPALAVRALEDGLESIQGQPYSLFRISRTAEQAMESPSSSDLLTTHHHAKRDLSLSSGQRKHSGSTQGCVHETHHLGLSSAAPRAHHIRYVLCPHVSVTPESATFKGGQRSIWAAVEVSGRLSKLPPKDTDTGQNHNPVMTGSFIDHQLDRFFEYGCLYDLTVEILPVENTKIIQVLREQLFPTTIYAGSSILLLVEVEVHESDSSKLHQSHHVRQKSDELIEDLEVQLGSSQISYMRIKVTYSHSAFPQYHFRPEMTGVTSLQSRMETSAIASLRRYDNMSLWSPHPAPAPNPLFSLIERHWGEEKASDAMQQILTQRFTPRKPAETGCRLSTGAFSTTERGRSSSPCNHAPPRVPTRQTSLRAENMKNMPLNSSLNSISHVTPHISMTCGTDAASSASSATRGVESYSNSPKDPLGSDHTSYKDRHRRRMNAGRVDNSPLQKRRSVGAKSIRALVPRLSDFTSDSTTGRESRVKRGFTATASGRDRVKRESGR